MKVLVHLNHGSDKSYMIHFGNRATRRVIKSVLEIDQPDAAQVLYRYAQILKSVPVTEVPKKDKARATLEADFVVGHQGYIAERLA